jgi:hypothetical protein
MSDDAKMTSQVRKIVTANWLDISEIRVRVTRGVVHFQGHVKSISGDPQNPEGTEAGMRKLDEDVRNLKGFRGVAYSFDNWLRDTTGGWRQLGKKKDSSGRRRH